MEKYIRRFGDYLRLQVAAKHTDLVGPIR